MADKRKEILERLKNTCQIPRNDLGNQLNKLHNDIDLNKVKNKIETLKKQNNLYDFLILQQLE